MYFCRWASRILPQYMKKALPSTTSGCAIGGFRRGLLGELLEYIQNIRASERRVYQKVKELFTLSMGYERKIQVA